MDEGEGHLHSLETMDGFRVFLREADGQKSVFLYPEIEESLLETENTTAYPRDMSGDTLRTEFPKGKPLNVLFGLADELRVHRSHTMTRAGTIARIAFLVVLGVGVAIYMVSHF